METNLQFAHDRYADSPPSLGYDYYRDYAAKSTKKPRPHRPAYFYIPPALRLPSLLIVFLISVAIIGAVEYGLQKLPHAQKSIDTNPKVAIQSLLHKRQTSTTIANQYASTAPPSTTPTTIEGSTAPVDPPPTTTAAETSYVPTITSYTTGNYVSTDTPPTGTVYETATTDYVATSTPSSTTAYFAPAESYVTTSTPILVTATAAPSSYVSEGQSATTSITVPTTMVTSVASTLVATDAAGQLTTMTTYIPTTSTGLATVATVIAGKNNSTEPENQFPLWTVFVGNYLALVIAVLLRQFWTAIYAQAKLIEPFIRLAEGRGVPASAVLSTFYLSSNIIPEPILALSKRLWIVLWTSSIYFVVGFLAPLSSELLFLNTKYSGCPFPQPNNPVNPCWPPRLSIDPVLSRIVQGLLTYIAIMTLTLMLMTFRVRTGIYSDPSSIGSIAALVHHPGVIEDFRTLSEDASIKDINQLLGDKLYQLGEYQRQDGTWRYGLVPVASTFQHYVRDGPPPTQKRSRNGRRKVLDIFFDILFLLILLALFGVVMGYYKDGKDDAFNRFFNSTKFGPKFVLTGVGTLIAINWKRLERDAHTHSPYSRMAKSPADPKSTILLRKSSIPLTSIFPMLFKGYFLATAMAIIAVFADILIIFLGAVPFASGQVYMELLVASYTSLAILGIMVLGLVTLFLWKRVLPHLPRTPDTIAAVASYLADSRMLDDFEGCEYLGNRELSNRIAGLGKRYVYGKWPGSDGQSRYLIDEDTQLIY